MKRKVVRIILVLLILVISFGASYGITYIVDEKERNRKEASIDVVFDDNEFYVMPSSGVLTEEEALKEWPYKFKVSNKGNTRGIYQIAIKDDLENDLERDCLNYILYLDDKEVKKGKLNELKNNLLYEMTIDANKEQFYQLYIYKSMEDEGTVYKYSILFDAIMEGGPGF